MAYDLTDDENKNYKRLTNATPERFQNSSDLQEYMHGVFDVVYSLDYAEAMSVIEQGKDVARKWFYKLEKVPNGVNAVDKLREFTDDEWSALTLSSIDDLITNEFVTKREYAVMVVPNNTYQGVHLFAGMYGAGESTTGTPGGLTFKRMAFELLASDGYEGGFLPYASNMYANEAKAQGHAGLSDSFIISKITNGQYNSLTEYKKKLFKERIDKLNNGSLKQITVNGQTISSYADLKRLMDEAVQADITSGNITNGGKSKVRALKHAIYREYLLGTNDFRTSIFE